MPEAPSRRKAPPLHREGKIANGDQGEKFLKLPQSCFACQPLFVEGGLWAVGQSRPPLQEVR